MNFNQAGTGVATLLAQSADPSGDGYERVADRSQETRACVRACEAEAATKVASDYSHIVWAYGVIWSLFVVYGVYLWRRAVRQTAEVADLQRRLS